MHTIYRIPNIKIGCSKDFNQRQLDYPIGTVFEVIQELHGFTDEDASKVEHFWADLYGYPRGQKYYIAINARKAAGAKAGKIACETGQFYEYCAAGGRVSGALARDTGRLLEVSAAGGRVSGPIQGSIQGQKNVESGHISRLGKTQGQKNVESGRLKKQAETEVVCDVCGKKGKGLVMQRWHFNNCKSRSII